MLTSFITSAKFTRHEFEEYVLPLVEAESLSALTNPATRAIELAHSLAFRSGLGSSLFASPNNHLYTEDVKAFAASAFQKGNIAVLGAGIDQTTLSKLVANSLGSSSAATTTAPSTPPTSYFGGETRVEAHGGPQTIFIGFGATGSSAPEIAALSAHLSPQSAIKWSRGQSPIAAKIPHGTSVQTVFLPYSDATLFGLLVQGPTGESTKEAGKVAVKALKDSAVSGGLKGEELKKAVAKAKFAAASAIESDRDAMVTALGSKASNIFFIYYFSADKFSYPCIRSWRALKCPSNQHCRH